MANKKFWIDTLVANELDERLIPIMEHLFFNDYTAVCSDTAIDVRAFQDHVDWFEDQASKNRIIIEAFYVNFDELTFKPFFWSSMDITTPGASSFDIALGSIPPEDYDAINFLSESIDFYCIEKEEWIEGRPAYKAPGKLSTEAQSVLNLPEDATRTDVLAAAKAANRMDLFETFNAAYVEGLARQHDCEYVLSLTGVTKLPSQK